MSIFNLCHIMPESNHLNTSYYSVYSSLSKNFSNENYKVASYYGMTLLCTFPNTHIMTVKSRHKIMLDALGDFFFFFFFFFFNGLL